ncbi:thiamine phosphate synthase [Aliiruegeria sabulilitoris]|uniref:thiamine phosphate synthase n=1 Tax=Aliiruegeria sabulilitoris TaxID=1510458 RepID=UPI000832890F|nr:thiamine phosphate synthase [Aliiruegeria sabulilitoris]NDR54849.1 thiamine phosphate synthase [Pseudoruegeria sp. M32A2M]
MAEQEHPQIYLISPPEFELSRFPDQLARVLDAREIACFRLALASQDEDRIARAADACRAVCHERDIAIVISQHLRLAERLGLDGVHLDGARGIRDARTELGEDAIVGAYCGASRHDGMNAGEAGADYVAFGPAGDTPLGDGTRADLELFSWWSEMIEVPVVAEGALNQELVATLSPSVDFFGIGSEIWSAEDPAVALGTLLAKL